MSDIDEKMRAALARMLPRDPRQRYWTTPGGWIIGRTTERTGGHKSDSKTAGRFAAFVYRPVGPGSQSGERARTKLLTDGKVRVLRNKLVRESYRVSRKAALKQALRWYKARLAEEATHEGRPYQARAAKLAAEWADVEVVGRGRLEHVPPSAE